MEIILYSIPLKTTYRILNCIDVIQSRAVKFDIDTPLPRPKKSFLRLF